MNIYNGKNYLNDESVKKIHFIGIGGSGMCPLADILKSKGYVVAGSDNYMSDTLERLIARGFSIRTEHSRENVKDVDLVVYSAAIKEDNEERLAAKELNIPQIERSDLLGMLCEKYENLIAISGTHGKTTTTAMITQILILGNADPTAIIGGKLPFIDGNSRVGGSETIICEACEYVDTFLKLTPSISIITNVDADHLDYFKDLDGVIRSFNKFAQRTKNVIIVNGDDKNSLKAIENVGSVRIITFGFNESNDYHIENAEEKNGIYESFEVFKGKRILGRFSLQIPGKHNVYNAVAAICVADYVEISSEVTKKALRDFTGVHRRFEVLSRANGMTIVDDFAHHPTEIENTLLSAKKMGFHRVIAIFQPHTYSRTAALLDDFAKALSIADIAIISEILAVREVNVYNICSEDLVNKIENSVYLQTFEDIADYIEEIAQPGDLIITMGGGNVYACANLLVKRLKML